MVLSLQAYVSISFSWAYMMIPSLALYNASPSEFCDEACPIDMTLIHVIQIVSFFQNKRNTLKIIFWFLYLVNQYARYQLVFLAWRWLSNLCLFHADYVSKCVLNVCSNTSCFDSFIKYHLLLPFCFQWFIYINFFFRLYISAERKCTPRVRIFGNDRKSLN